MKNFSVIFFLVFSLVFITSSCTADSVEEEVALSQSNELEFDDLINRQATDKEGNGTIGNSGGDDDDEDHN